jgi:hypothetical protein
MYLTPRKPTASVPYYENATEPKQRSRHCEREGARYGHPEARAQVHRAAAAMRSPRGAWSELARRGSQLGSAAGFLSRPCADASGVLSLRSRLTLAEPGCSGAMFQVRFDLLLVTRWLILVHS